MKEKHGVWSIPPTGKTNYRTFNFTSYCFRLSQGDILEVYLWCPCSINFFFFFNNFNVKGRSTIRRKMSTFKNCEDVSMEKTVL